MPPRIKSTRERAARALCERQGLVPDTTFEGRPMWMNLLGDADAVLRAALGDDAWAAMVEAERQG